MNNKHDSHPQNQKSGQQNCATCKHYIPCKDDWDVGRCMQLTGSHGTYTIYEYCCVLHEQQETVITHKDMIKIEQ